MGSAHDNAILNRIHERLEHEMTRVREEIRRYPAPIPACDAQFNYLLESREGLSTVLARVRQLIADESTNAASGTIESFLDASDDLSDVIKSDIRTIIENEARQGEGRR